MGAAQSIRCSLLNDKFSSVEDDRTAKFQLAKALVAAMRWKDLRRLLIAR
jgi:hypothetical protein